VEIINNRNYKRKAPIFLVTYPIRCDSDLISNLAAIQMKYPAADSVNGVNNRFINSGDLRPG